MGTSLKLGSIRISIAAYTAGLQRSRSEKVSPKLRPLAEFCSEFGDHTVSDLLGGAASRVKLSDLPSTSMANGPTISEVVPHLAALQHAFSDEGLNAEAGSLKLLIDLLRAGDGTKGDSRYLSRMLEVFRKVLVPSRSSTTGRPDVEICRYIELLKAEVGTDNFAETLAALAASKLKREHVVEIARSVYGGIPKSTSRKAALGYIRKPHDAFMSAKRGIDAMKGRSAA